MNLTPKVLFDMSGGTLEGPIRKACLYQHSSAENLGEMENMCRKYLLVSVWRVQLLEMMEKSWGKQYSNHKA